MIRSCVLTASTMICWILVGMNLPAAKAQDDNPFGDPAEAKQQDENPFGDSAPPERAADPFSSEPPQVAAKRTPAAPRPQKPASSNQRVRDALHQPTQMEFHDAPFQDVIYFLKDFHQIEIQLDHRALADAGVSSDTPVSRTLSGLPLESALRILLGDLDLAHVVRNDVLLVTTMAKANEMREVRVYDVTKLVAPDAKAEEIAETLVMLLSESPQQSGGGLQPPGLQKIRIVPLRHLLVIRASQGEHAEITSVLGELLKALAAGG